jgi:ABC-type polysaccharide/polyol phosphate export permease
MLLDRVSQPVAFRLSNRLPLFDLAAKGARDIVNGLRQWRLCYLIGSADMRRRYARSRLGQLWIMISSAIFVSTMAFVWSFLWHQPVHDMLPFIAIGMMVWQLILGILNESTTALASSRHYFLNQYMPASAILFAVLYRNGVTYLFNIVFPLLICLAFGVPFSLSALLALPGLALLFVTCFAFGFVIAILCARFQDIVQIVANVLQIAFFLSPVLWKPELLPPEAQGYLILNPFAVLVAIVRDPLLGRPLPMTYWGAAVLLAIASLLLALPFIGKFCRRLVYWL